MKFEGSCLKQEKKLSLSYKWGRFIYCLWIRWSRDLNIHFKLTKDFDPDNYGYSCYYIRLDALSHLPLPNVEWGENWVFDVDNSLSANTDNRKKKDVLIPFLVKDWQID